MTMMQQQQHWMLDMMMAQKKRELPRQQEDQVDFGIKSGCYWIEIYRTYSTEN